MLCGWKQRKYSALSLILTAGISAGLGCLGLLLFQARTPPERPNPEVLVAKPSMLGERTKLESGGLPKATADKSYDDWLAFAQQPPAAEQVEAFLQSRGRDAESLVSMYKLTWNHDLMKEAMRVYPDDPLVQSVVVTHKYGTVEEQLEWAARWITTDPDNALARYMSASIKAESDPASAVKDLVAAMSLHQNHDHREATQINHSAFYESTGMPTSVAQVAAAMSQGTPAKGSLRRGARAIVAYAASQREAGQTEEADRAYAAILAMGQRHTQDSGTIIESLVGLSIERMVLKDYEGSESTPTFLDRSVVEYQESLDTQMEDLRGYTQKDAFERMREFSNNPSDLNEYVRRLYQLGEVPALQWWDRQQNLNP